MKKTRFILFLFTSIVLASCQEVDTEMIDVNDSIEYENVYEPDQRALEIDRHIEMIDANFELRIYSSLEYMNGDGQLYEVHAYRDTIDTNFLKIIEYTSAKLTGTLQSNTFYYKKGKKVASRELSEEGGEGDLHFVERLTYYDDNEEKIVTKERTAEYEEQLEDAAFIVGSPNDLLADRANRALNQSEEFAPLFEGFVEGEEGDLYLVVGDNKPNGYTSALLVQSRNGLVDRMYKDPDAYKGKQLSIAFSKEMSPDGNYQLLYGASLVE